MDEATLEIRRTGITGSDVGPIHNVDHYRGPLDVFNAKVGNTPPPEDNEFMRFGREMEPIIGNRFAEQHPDVELHHNEQTFRMPQEPWVIGTPDFLATRDGRPVAIVEAKTAGERALYYPETDARHWGEPGTDRVPPSYFFQLLWYMRMFGTPKGYVAAFIGRSYCEYEVSYHEGLAEAAYRRCREFKEGFMDTQTPPGPEFSKDPMAAMRALWPESKNELMTAGAAEEEMAHALRRNMEKLDALAEEVEQQKAVVQAVLQDREGMVGSFGKILWKSHTGSRTSWKKVAEQFRALLGHKPADELDAIVSEHTSQSVQRPFRTYWKDVEDE